MLISLKDPNFVQSLIDNQVLKPESIYLTNGQPLGSDTKNIYKACMVLRSDLNRGTEVYLEAYGLFKELECCYRLLSKALTTDEVTESFSSIIMQIAERLRAVARNRFDLAYAYLSWHTIEDYPVMHHLIVALTIARVGEESGEFSDAELNSCLGAALTMNISMLTLQSQLRLQTDPLTKEQRESIRKHPEQGASRLRLMGVTDERWLDMVMNHHELPNGQGYPKQIKMTDKTTLLLGICDSFNARIAQRDYRDNFTAEEAIKELFAKADPAMCDLVAVLLEELGIYPAGSLLQLQGNQIGCSLIRGQSTTSPIVLVFRNSDQSPDSTMLVDTSRREYAVRKALPRRELSQLPGLLEIISKIA